MNDKIISWYRKWKEEEKNIFDKFIYLWFSFNWYYYEFISDDNWLKKDYKIFLNWKSDSENQQIK